jgi:hypothetical protein
MNWRLIFFSAIGAALGFNLLIFLLVVILFYSGIFAGKSVDGLETYLIPFALFSPLLASFVSTAFVTHFSRARKLAHTIISTFVTFTLTSLILFYLTAPISIGIYDNFSRLEPVKNKSSD